MKIKKSIPIKLMLVLALTVGTVIAATPGSACLLRATALGVSLDFPGTVDSSGQLCGVPNQGVNVGGIIIPVPGGFTCGTTVSFDPGPILGGVDVLVEAICPN
jgi:hypothetical protein